MPDKIINIFDRRASDRIVETVLWADQYRRRDRPLSPTRSVPVTKNQKQFAILQDDIEHGQFGPAIIASATSYDATLQPLTGADPVDVYNPGPKAWSGATVEWQMGAIAQPDTGQGQRPTILTAWSATRIRGLAAADIDPGQSGIINSVVPINGHYGPVSATVFLPTAHVSIKQGLVVWAELRYDETSGFSFWDVYSADCDPGGGGGGTNQLFPDDNGDVAWDIDVNGKVCTLELETVASGNPIKLLKPVGLIDRDQLFLTVKQDATGGHILHYDSASYFFPYGEPVMDTSPNAVELVAFTGVQTATDLDMVGQALPDLNPARVQIDDSNVVNLSATNAAVVETGRGPTITNGPNALDGSDATFCTLIQDTIVQNANQEWAVRIEFTNQVAITELVAVGLANCSFLAGERYPNDIKVYFFANQNGTGGVVHSATLDPALFWAAGIQVPTDVYCPLNPYDGPFQSVEFWFSFVGRNSDTGNIQFSRAIVASRLPGWTGT
jgi:hypothetical protein